MKKRIKENKDIIEWFSSFLIYNPVSRDRAFHDNYFQVIDKIDSKELRKSIKKFTYQAIKKLINNLRGFGLNQQEKSKLKNLGEFLGLITIARN